MTESIAVTFPFGKKERFCTDVHSHPQLQKTRGHGNRRICFGSLYKPNAGVVKPGFKRSNKCRSRGCSNTKQNFPPCYKVGNRITDISQKMGEELKEPVKEEQAEKKKEAAEEKKSDEPQEIILKVDMHCEGCAKKVEKSLLRFEGVENVKADSRSKTVVVKSRTADPAKVCQRVQRKTKRRVELISPLPPPPEDEKKEETPAPLPEEKKEEPPKIVTVILKVQMHCDACATILQKRISKIEGVESVETDLFNDQVVVKGVMDPAVLIDSIQRKTRRPAVIVEEEKPPEEEKKVEEEEKKPDEDKKADGIEEVKKYDFWPPVQYYVEYVYPYPLPPPPTALVSEEFSDENPNACTVA